MATYRADVPNLYSIAYDVFMLQAFKEETLKMPMVFTVASDNSKEVKTHSLSALGIWDEHQEGAELQFEDPLELYEKTFTHLKYRKGFQVSWEALDDDEYALLKQQNTVKAMGRGARARVEKASADILNNCSTDTGPDGASLASASHPKNPLESTTYYSNLITTALSHDALEEMEQKVADNSYDSKGLVIDIEPTILLVPPALKGIALRLCKERAGERPDTMNRDINIYAGKYQVVVWKQLSAANGGSDVYWYLIAKDMGAKWFWRDKPHFYSWIDYKAENYMFSGRMRSIVGYDDWRWCWISNGTS